MDNIERDFEYDQKIEDITGKLELLILKAMSSVLDSRRFTGLTATLIRPRMTLTGLSDHKGKRLILKIVGVDMLIYPCNQFAVITFAELLS